MRSCGAWGPLATPRCVTASCYSELFREIRPITVAQSLLPSIACGLLRRVAGSEPYPIP